jgi:DNA-binding CsgD family transcriptional regulator
MHDLVDALYEAAFIPEKWPAVLARMADTAGTKNGVLFVFADGMPARGRTAPLQQALMNEILADPSLRLAPAAIAARLSARPAGFVEADGLMTREEIRDDPLRIKLRSGGLGAQAGTVIPMPSGELAMFVFERALEDGAHPQESIVMLDRMRPDMARACLVAARLELEQARGTVEALAMIGLPAAVLAANGRVRVTNALFDRENALFIPTAFGGVALSDPESNRLFQMALKGTVSGSGQLLRSIPVRFAAASSVIVHVLPLTRDAHDLFSGGDLLVAATAISASVLVPSPTILTGLFDLTPAEVKLATALAMGRALKSAAVENGVTFSTARTYLDRIYRKTGTNRQSQLVALLKSAGPFKP